MAADSHFVTFLGLFSYVLNSSLGQNGANTKFPASAPGLPAL